MSDTPPAPALRPAEKPTAPGAAFGGAKKRGARDRLESIIVHLVFVVSGIAALLYQLIWQRSLLLIYGSNTESVAMVVSAFLCGLGLGSIIGGAVSRLERAPRMLLQ